MDYVIVRIMIFFAFYVIGAYATTDMLRLLKGSRHSVWESACYCPLCGHKLSARDQLPLIGYLLNHGRCRYCKNRIPFSDLFPELFLSVSMACISIKTSYSWTGFLLCLGLYEGVKIYCLFEKGRREKAFWKNLFCSLLFNLIIFSMLAILFLLCKLVR